MRLTAVLHVTALALAAAPPGAVSFPENPLITQPMSPPLGDNINCNNCNAAFIEADYLNAAEKRQDRLFSRAVERLESIARGLTLAQMCHDRVGKRQRPAVVEELAAL